MASGLLGRPGNRGREWYTRRVAGASFGWLLCARPLWGLRPPLLPVGWAAAGVWGCRPLALPRAAAARATAFALPRVGTARATAKRAGLARWLLRRRGHALPY